MSKKDKKVKYHFYVYVGRNKKEIERNGEIVKKNISTANGARYMIKKFDHSSLNDQNNPGHKVQMVKIYLPQGSFNFPPDKNGNERNDRRAYIQLPFNKLDPPSKNKKVNKYFDYKYVDLSSKPVFNVYFENRRLPPINGVPQWQPNVEKITISTEELVEMFPDPFKDKDLKKDRKKPPVTKHISKKNGKIVVKQAKENGSQQKEPEKPKEKSKARRMLRNLKNKSTNFSQEKVSEKSLER